MFVLDQVRISKSYDSKDPQGKYPKEIETLRVRAQAEASSMSSIKGDGLLVDKHVGRKASIVDKGYREIKHNLYFSNFEHGIQLFH